MKKTIRLTEDDLTRIVNKVIEEQNVANAIGNFTQGAANVQNAIGDFAKKGLGMLTGQNDKRIQSIVNNMKSLKTVPTQVIQSKNPKLNGMPWSQFVQIYKVTPQEIERAKQIMKGGTTGGAKKPTQQGAKPVASQKGVTKQPPTSSGQQLG